MSRGTQTRIAGFRRGANAVQSPSDRYVFASLQMRGQAESITEPSLDQVFELVSNARRRWVCRYLDANPDGVDLGPLSEFVAAIENDVDRREVSSSERKRVYISLYQCHLPKMDAFGAVDFDADRKTIRPGSSLGTFVAGLEAVERHLRSLPED